LVFYPFVLFGFVVLNNGNKQHEEMPSFAVIKCYYLNIEI